jgi:hypothetical protein
MSDPLNHFKWIWSRYIFFIFEGLIFFLFIFFKNKSKLFYEWRKKTIPKWQKWWQLGIFFSFIFFFIPSLYNFLNSLLRWCGGCFWSFKYITILWRVYFVKTWLGTLNFLSTTGFNAFVYKMFFFIFFVRVNIVFILQRRNKSCLESATRLSFYEIYDFQNIWDKTPI